MRGLALLGLAACGVEPGSEGTLAEEPVDPGGAGIVPRAALAVTLQPGLVTGEAVTFRVSGANAGEIVRLKGSRVGTGSGPCPATLGGLCLDLQPPILNIGAAPANASGVAFIPTNIPGTWTSGTLSVQAVIQRGAGGSLSVKSDARTDGIYPHWDSGLAARPANPGCRAPADPPVRDRAVSIERAFPLLTFGRPTEMVQPPGDPGTWWIAEKNNERILRFTDDDSVSTTSVVIDLSSTIYSASNEMGLLGFAFHPDFANNGEVYLSYNRSSGGYWDEVVRYTSSDGGLTLDPASAQVVISIPDPYTNHNGGKVAFGPDGYLYYAVGDGGSGGDPLGSGQDTFSELGKMLRIDVDGGLPYAIPADNPFADGVAGVPEVYAWGLRNPWRWSFDRATGDLWLGDVGQDIWEEVDRIELGGNYGWNWREGFACYTAGCDTVPGLVDPVVAYDPGGAASVIGGFVYRGSALPQLVGTYVFTDYYTQDIEGVVFDGSGQPSQQVLLANTGVAANSFAEDADGELYLLEDSGEVWRIVPPLAPPPVDDFPTLLSETGCFDPLDPTVPDPALIPFEPNAPLWSDGADKQRWLAIPDGTTITVNPDGDWDFPIGTVLAKEFRMAGQLLETRLLVRHDDGSWAGYAYAWDATGTEATLADGGTTVGTWRVPSSSECLQCHTAAAGYVLGLETAQLNRSYGYPGVSANQLSTLDQIGMFTAPLGRHPDQLPAMPDPADLAVPDEARARAYLHANCSICHRPGGPTPVAIDLRYAVADTGGCGVAPTAGDLGVPGALVIDPGVHANSVLSLRMHATDVTRMPPLATEVVDPTGTSVVDAWIDGMTACPP